MLRTTTALAILASLFFAPTAAAVGEQGDAGDLPATAQDLSGAGVTQIDGSFSSAVDFDVYKLCLPGGGTFSASTVGGTTVDTQLFLFDAAGRGVYGNDDAGGSQSDLPAGHALTPQPPGEYYLAITSYNWDPRSDGGAIFPALPNVPAYGGVLAPNGPGAADPVNGWFGRAGQAGDYTIALAGATCVAPDTTAPTVDLRSPLDGAVYLLDEEVVADYSCADPPGGSGVATCAGPVADGAAVDTGSVGQKTFAVQAADAAGNTAVARSVYRVVYDFEGFLWPVRNRPHVNRWRAGLPVPIRFELGGNQGLEVIEEGWPKVAEIRCGSHAEPGGGEEARHPRWFRELVYRKHRRRYVFLWKTERSWAGSCRQFMLRLDDGTTHRADFQFSRRWRW